MSLHISGNGLTGSIPNNIQINDRLKDLTLSYNILTGSIPHSIQDKKWDRLDLSYNKITGTILSDFVQQSVNNSIVYLNVNRLSSLIPTSLVDIQQINILLGNLFSCDFVDRLGDLPSHDPSLQTYDCGSRNFIISYICYWGVSIGISVLCLIILYKTNICKLNCSLLTLFKEMMDRVKCDYRTNFCLDENIQSLFLEIHLFFKKFDILMKFASYLTLYIVTVFLALFCINGELYGMYTSQYAYLISFAFKSGFIPFIIIFLAILIFLFLVIYLFIIAPPKDLIKSAKLKLSMPYTDHDAKKIENIIVWRIYKWIQEWMAWSIAPMINIIVVGMVNASYADLFLVLYKLYYYS